MTFRMMSTACIALSLAGLASAAHAAQVKLSFDYDITVLSIPDDNIPNKYHVSDKGSALVDFDVDPDVKPVAFDIKTASGSEFSYNIYGYELSGNDGNGFSFDLADIALPTAPGRYSFSYHLSDFTSPSMLTIPGGTTQAIQPTVDLNGTVLISTVPLPSSAPMFGAALLGLGVVGYGVKRKKAAAAA